MADLEDLGYPSIIDMDNDEAIDLLRQLRLSRRTPEKKTKATKETTKQTRTKVMASIDSDLATKLLKTLGGEE